MINLYCVVMHLYFYCSEHTRATCVQGLTWNCLSGPIRALQALEGMFTDSSIFVNIWVTETLKRHRKSHFFEIIRYVMTDHEGGGRDGREQEWRVKLRWQQHTKCETSYMITLFGFFWQTGMKKNRQQSDNPQFFQDNQLPIFSNPT